MQYCTLQCCTVIYSAVLYTTKKPSHCIEVYMSRVDYCTVQCSTVESIEHYCAVEMTSVDYCTVQYCNVQCIEHYSAIHKR